MYHIENSKSKEELQFGDASLHEGFFRAFSKGALALRDQPGKVPKSSLFAKKAREADLQDKNSEKKPRKRTKRSRRHRRNKKSNFRNHKLYKEEQGWDPVQMTRE